MLLFFLSASGIDWQAFVDYVSSYSSLRDVESEYRDAFRIYDVSGTGVLSRDDIKYVLGKLNIRVNLDELMDQVDTNRDGSIEYDGKLQGEAGTWRVGFIMQDVEFVNWSYIFLLFPYCSYFKKSVKFLVPFMLKIILFLFCHFGRINIFNY